MGQGHRDLSAKWIAEEVENSLRRLQTDYIDLYQTHWPDPNTPQEETLGRLRETGQGGQSARDRLHQLRHRAAQRSTRDFEPRNGWPRYETLQNEYNLYAREPFEEVQEICVKEEISGIHYFALARGFVTGQVPHARPTPARAREGQASSTAISTTRVTGSWRRSTPLLREPARPGRNRTGVAECPAGNGRTNRLGDNGRAGQGTCPRGAAQPQRVRPQRADRRREMMRLPALLLFAFAAPAVAQEAGWQYSPYPGEGDRAAMGCAYGSSPASHACIVVRCDDDYSVGLYIETSRMGGDAGEWSIGVDDDATGVTAVKADEAPYGARIEGDVSPLIDHDRRSPRAPGAAPAARRGRARQHPRGRGRATGAGGASHRGRRSCGLGLRVHPPRCGP